MGYVIRLIIVLVELNFLYTAPRFRDCEVSSFMQNFQFYWRSLNSSLDAVNVSGMPFAERFCLRQPR